MYLRHLHKAPTPHPFLGKDLCLFPVSKDHIQGYFDSGERICLKLFMSLGFCYQLFLDELLKFFAQHKDELMLVKDSPANVI